MAQRLTDNCDEAAFLGVFDTYAGEYPRVRKDLSRRQKLRLAIQLQLTPYLNHINRGPYTVRRFLRSVKKSLQRRFVNLDLLFHQPLFRPYRWRHLYLEKTCFAARRNYTLRPFPGEIHLFRVEEQPSPEFFEQDPMLGWNGIGLGGIKVHELPGRHGFYLRQPNVEVLAQKLRQSLERVRNPA
jgi:thioesterase domain-containing protein